MIKKSITIKCALIAATGIVSMMLAAPAKAETTPAAPAANSLFSAPGEDDGKFSERREKLLGRIAARIVDVQQLQSCVQAASDLAALNACFPLGEQGTVKEDGKFSESKEELLGHIAGRITDGQQFQSCVQVASDLAALNACFPGGKQGDEKPAGQH